MTLSKNTMRNTSSTVNKGRIKENSHASTVKTTPTKKSSKGNDIVCVWQNKSTHFGNRKVQTISEYEKSLAS